MGKYIRKSKTTWEVTVTQSSSLSLGVRTRAQKTLAAQQQPTNSGGGGGGSYLQLRSRRLEKPPTHKSKRSAKSISRIRASSISPEEKSVEEKQVEKSHSKDVDEGIEASFGENCLELDGRERSTRESTPCSLSRDPDAIRTPGSTTRSPELSRTIQTPARRLIPTAQEMDAFFAAAEEREHREFIEKYNFDPVSEEPLPGHYKWVKVDP